MKKNKLFFGFAIFCTIAATALFVNRDFFKNKFEIFKQEQKDEYDGPDKAAEFDYKRFKDPKTGKVPMDKMWNAVMVAEDLRAQKINSPSSTSALTWAERGSSSDVVGPSNGNTRPGNGVTSGRVRAVWVDLADPSGKTVWTAGVNGGLWKTTDITAATPIWILVDDFLSNLAVTGICQDPTNPSIMYFCTGESFFNADAVNGNGVFKSTNNGATWAQLTNTSTLTRCSKILCDAAGNVYLSTIGISVAAGLQRSANGGTSWTSINPFTTTSRITDFEISSTGTMHVVGGLFSAVGVGGYRFTNNPATVTSTSWTTPSTPFTVAAGTAGARNEIAVSGNNVYVALAHNNAANNSSKIDSIAKSTDGGNTWVTLPLTATNISDLNGGTGQGWYAIGLAVDPSDPNNVVVGSLNTLKSVDGGTTFTKISEWFGTSGQYVHADIHNITWYDNGNKLLIGCDGGIHYSNNKGLTFSDKNQGLRLKQFYSVAIHPTSTNYFLGGTQDNGTHQLNGAGLTTSVEVTGGDGAYVAIDQDEPQYQFGAYVFNQYRRSTNGGATWSSVNFSSSSGQFINPFDYDNTGNIMYCSHDAGKFLRWDNPQTGNTSTIVGVTGFGAAEVASVAVSPYTANRVYFGTTAGKIIKVDNANAILPATITEADITPTGMPTTVYVNSIVVGKTDQNLMATVTNYGQSNVWYSSNGGTSWTVADGNLPDMPVFWSLFNPDDNNKAYIATIAGVWSTELLNGASTIWTPETTFPAVRTDMLKYRASDKLIAAATHGRGIWTANLPTGCVAASIITQPTSKTVCTSSSSNTSFAITTDGASFQWQSSPNGTAWTNIVNGGVFGGATTTTLTLTGVSAALNNTQYRCVVTNGCSPTATTNSAAATLTVNPTATVNSQPTAKIICENLSTTFSVNATGSLLTYVWQVSTNNGGSFSSITNTGVYTGATTNTLSITGATFTLNDNLYRCVISDACANTNSTSAKLTVNASPTTFNVTGGGAYCFGGTGMPIGVSGSNLGISYQLKLNGVNDGVVINGTGTALSFGNKTVAGNYTVVATNTTTSCVNQMNSIALIIINPPALVTLAAQPYTRLLPGQTTTLTASVSNPVTPLSYVWQKNNANISNTSSSLNIGLNQLGTYKVIITDGNGCVSESAIVPIADSASNKLFIYPSPNTGQFNVAYYNSTSTTVKQIISIYSAKGETVYNKEFFTTQPYQLFAVDLRRYSAGVYYVVLRDANGKKIEGGEVLVQ